MSERLSEDAQARDLHAVLSLLEAKGRYADELRTAIPHELALHLPTGVFTPASGSMRIARPESQASSLRLRWEYNPSIGLPQSRIDTAGEQAGWQELGPETGIMFAVWRPNFGEGAVERVSGMLAIEATAMPLEVAADLSADLDNETLHATLAEAEADSWRCARLGILDPRIGFDEAGVVIGFARSLI